MNSKNISAILDGKESCTCMHCLSENKPLRKIEIEETGYGTLFDRIATTIQLCEECYNASNPVIWSMEKVNVRENKVNFSPYKYEKEMMDYIYALPLQSQELVINRFYYGYDNNRLKPQDWIDYMLNELPYEKCKEYGIISPIEIDAYKERYPKCTHVKKEESNSVCAINIWVCGDFPENTEPIYYPECYQCPHFEEK